MSRERLKAMIAFEEITDVQADGTVVVRRPELKPGEKVKVIVLTRDQVTNRPNDGRLTQDWAGGLSELAKDFTNGQLQHNASEWR